ncbi:MAG: helix-turn-helix domain-containing protein, partial [Paracoccaceae bacterium]
LKNSIERAVLLGTTTKITVEDLELGSGHIIQNYPAKVKYTDKVEIEIPPQGISLVELERVAIEKAMKMAKGNLSMASRLLRISRETLRYRLKKHFISELRSKNGYDSCLSPTV